MIVKKLKEIKQKIIISFNKIISFIIDSMKDMWNKIKIIIITTIVVVIIILIILIRLKMISIIIK